MDWGPVLIFALGGVFNALLGGVSAEWLSRRAERRQAKTAADDRVRARKLEILRQTREMTLAWCEWRLRVIVGSRPFDPADFDDSRWPMAATKYVGREAAEGMLRLKAILEGGDRDEQIRALAAFRQAAMEELELQEERALRDEPLVVISRELDAQLDA